jgi:hypothetical protein
VFGEEQRVKSQRKREKQKEQEQNKEKEKEKEQNKNKKVDNKNRTRTRTRTRTTEQEQETPKMKGMILWIIFFPFVQSAYVARISRKTATNQVTLHGNYLQIGEQLDENQNTDAEVKNIKEHFLFIRFIGNWIWHVELSMQTISLSDRRTKWSTHRPTDWSTHRPTDWSTHRTTEWSTHRPTDWSTHRTTDWSTHRPTDW